MASISRRGDAYLIRVSGGYTFQGKQKVQSKTWNPAPGMTATQIEKEVNRQAVLFEEECKKGQVTSAVKFETFAEEWLNDYAKLNLRNTSYERNLQLRTRIYPVFGHLRLDKITTRLVQKFINDLHNNGKNMNNGKPLSRKTIVLHLSFISCVLDYAIRMEILTDNPCSRVSVPKGESQEKSIYTKSEIERIFVSLDTEPLMYRLFFKLAVFSGFRRGELLGLEWGDIDYDNCTIRVQRTSNHTPSKGTYTDTTKTKKSQRILNFPTLIMDLLKEYKAEQDTLRENLGDKWKEHDRLFVKWNGAPLYPNQPYRWFKRFCERNNFRFCDIHSLRHLHCSLLISQGMDVVAVSADMGHSNVTTTMNTYSHMFQEARARNCEAITNALSFGNYVEQKAS